MSIIRSAIFRQYNLARSCGKIDRMRTNRALGIIQHGEPRPYKTTLHNCTCPDTVRPCKHITAKWILYRAFQQLLTVSDNVTITNKVFIDGEIFPLDPAYAHTLAQQAGFTARKINGGIAYRKG